MAAVGQAASRAATEKSASGRTIVLEQELRALWLGGRALVMCFAFSLLLSVIAYLVATNTDLNFLEQRESVNLTLQVAIAVGALLALLAAADTISGERERGTLEPSSDPRPPPPDRDRKAARGALALARGICDHPALR